MVSYLQITYEHSLIYLGFLNYIYYLCVHTHVFVRVCRLEDNLQSQLSPTVWVLGIRLRLWGLIANTFTH